MSGPEFSRATPERTLLHFVEDPVVVVSVKGLVAYVNPPFKERFKVDGQGAMGRSAQEILPAWMWEPVQEQLQAMAADSGPRHFWINTRREHFRVSMGGIAVSGKFMGAVVTLWDATREREVKQRNLALFRAMLEDLGYPLAEIQALVTRTGKITESVKTSAQTQAEQLAEGLRRFQEFGELLFGEIRAEQVPLQPGRLVSLAIKSLRPLAESRKVYLEDGSSRELPKIIGDPALLSRVLALFLDYMINLVPPREIVVSSAELLLMSDGTPHLAYAITGTGVVSPEIELVKKESQALEALSGLNDQRKRSLFRAMLAHRLVSAMAGNITIAAHELAGTTVCVRVPVSIHYGK